MGVYYDAEAVGGVEIAAYGITFRRDTAGFQDPPLNVRLMGWTQNTHPVSASFTALTAVAHDPDDPASTATAWTGPSGGNEGIIATSGPRIFDEHILNQRHGLVRQFSPGRGPRVAADRMIGVWFDIADGTDGYLAAWMTWIER